MNWTEAIDILHDGGVLIHKFYTRTDYWTILDKDGNEHKINRRTIKVLENSNSIVLTKNDFGAITTHEYKLNPKLKEK